MAQSSGLSRPTGHRRRRSARLSLIVLFPFLLSCRQEPAESHAQQAARKGGDRTEGMILVPSGAFLYGTDDKGFETYVSATTMRFPGMVDQMRSWFVIPPNQVSLPSYYIAEFEVTNAQFRQFLTETGYQPQDSTDFLKKWTSPREYPEWAAQFPVVWVSQLDASEFCRWLGGRLPSDEEWEKAARGADGRMFPWGNTAATYEQANFMTENLEPVGNRPGDRSPYGVYDMAGNVSELTASTTGEGARMRVWVRGGSFSAGAREMLTFQRSPGVLRAERKGHLGFRCVVDAPTGK